MSEFKIACPKCQQHILCDESHSGTQFACPSCGTQVAVPPLAGQAQAETRVAEVAPASPAPPELRPHIPPRPKVQAESNGKSWLTTFLLAWFLGTLGADRFYNGRTGLGIGKLLTFGGFGLWSFIDVLLLLFKKYQDAQGNYLRPAKRSHMVVALSVVGAAVLASVILIGSVAQGLKSEFAKMGSGAWGSDSRNGYATPEAVFEAMKVNPQSLVLLPPAERQSFAYLNVLMARAMVAAQSDETKKQEAEKAFTDLIEKFHLADKLEFNASSEMEQDEAMAAKAFAGVDLTALMDDFETFTKKYSTEQFSVSDGEDEAKPVSLIELKIEGDEATATMIASDDTEQAVVFVKSGGGWFYSLYKTSEKRVGGGAGGWGAGSEPLLLVVTFDSESSLKQATAKGLLEAVDYDRSEVPKLTPAGTTHHEATLSFTIPSSANKEAIIQSIRSVRGVAKVENLWTEELEATMAAKFAEAFNASTNPEASTAWESSVQSSATEVETAGTSSARKLTAPTQPETTSIEAERDDLFTLNVTNVAPGATIAVTFSKPMASTPGRRYWITVIEAKLSDSSSGKWKYVPDGAKDITLTTPNTAGDYDVRLHSDYPTKSFHVVQRTKINIETAASRSGEAALRFGTNDWLELSPIDWNKLGAFTVEVWVRDWKGGILNQGKVGDPENSIYLGLDRALNNTRNQPTGWESGGKNVEFAIGSVPSNQWIHVAMVFDGKEQAVFINGQQKRRVASPRPGPFDMRRQLIIGRGGQGTLRSIRVSSTVRYRNSFRPSESWKTDSQTLLLLEAGNRAGNTLKDSSGHGHDATIHGAPVSVPGSK